MFHDFYSTNDSRYTIKIRYSLWVGMFTIVNNKQSKLKEGLHPKSVLLC